MKILFCPIPQGKYWDGTTIYTDSLGGSEAAVAYTARALARAGEEVHVLGHIDPKYATLHREVDQVTYWPQLRMNELLSMEWDVVISSRWIEVLRDAQWKAPVTVAWIHDMPHDGWGVVPLTAVVFVSQIQQEAWGMTNENSAVVGNGVDLSLFRIPRERSTNKLIWTSNPDRGLALAAKIFQEIRKRWPDLELHVYGRASVYGWGMEVEGPYLPRPEHMENVFLHESVKRPALAKRLQEAWALFYPTYWPETYCMAALESQAAGTPVIAPPYAALKDTVKGGILTYDYLNAVSQLRNNSKYRKESEAALEWAQQNDWSVRAEEWQELLYGLLKEVSK